MSTKIEDSRAVIREEVTAAVADFPFRHPEIDDDAFSETGEFSRADRQWLLTTESIRRAILDDPTARDLATSFSSAELSESLPSDALQEVAAIDTRTAKLSKRMAGSLGKLLALEPIPEELIQPSLRQAKKRGLVTQAETVDQLTLLKQTSSGSFDDFLDRQRKSVATNPGVSRAEIELVAKRYGYARDVKLLGLMAEMQDQKPEVKKLGEGLTVTELDSGTKIFMTEEVSRTDADIFDPSKWESRRQIKDRVYEITIAGKEYVMKERKTNRHRDTISNDQESSTSKDEFSAAKDFSERGPISIGDTSIRWEEPLGYVEFPDGYQFCLFELENDLVYDPSKPESGLITDNSRAQQILEGEIIKQPETYSQEFEEFTKRALEIYKTRTDLLMKLEQRDKPRRSIFGFRGLAQKLKLSAPDEPVPQTLTFDDFAKLKAQSMVRMAHLHLMRSIHELGYQNADSNGHGFRIAPGERPVLEVIAFDFEYYKKDEKRANEVIEIMDDNNQNGDEITHYARSEFSSESAILLAASYAMFESCGLSLPPKKVT